MHKYLKKIVTFSLATAVAVTTVISSATMAQASNFSGKNFGLTETQVKFVENWRPLLEKLSKKYTKKLTKTYGSERGIPWLAVMAKAVWETGGGTSDLYLYKNNTLGIDAYPTATETAYEHGRYFSSVEDSFVCFYDFTSRGYTESIKAAHDPYAFIERSSAKYASDPNYSASTRDLVDKIALYCAKVDFERTEAKIAKKLKQKLKKHRKRRGYHGAGMSKAISKNLIKIKYETALRQRYGVSTDDEVIHTLALAVLYGHLGSGTEREALLGDTYELVNTAVAEISEKN